MSKVYEKVDFLSTNECDFLLSLYKKNKERDHVSCKSWDDTNIMWVHQTNPLSKISFFNARPPSMNWDLFHFRKTLLLNRITNILSKEFDLNLNYSQVVHWPCHSYKDLHYDGDDSNTNGTFNYWTSVCYLNDKYGGGETICDDQLIRPKKGKMVVFESKNVCHGVSPVTYGDRFTYISWWRPRKLQYI